MLLARDRHLEKEELKKKSIRKDTEKVTRGHKQKNELESVQARSGPFL